MSKKLIKELENAIKSLKQEPLIENCIWTNDKKVWELLLKKWYYHNGNWQYILENK